jgi:PUA domain protein
MPKNRRFFLKRREAIKLIEEASKKLKIDFKKLFGSDFTVELIETGFCKVYIINGKPILFEAKGNIYPTLLFKEIFTTMPKIVVDMGAIPHLCNGADVMAPGVIRLDGDFKVGDLVLVIDERHRKPLVIGEVLYDASEFVSVKRGVVVKNLHFVGDKIWRIIKECTTEHVKSHNFIE